MLQRAFSQQSFNRVAEDKLFWNNPALPSSRGPAKAQRSAAGLGNGGPVVASHVLASNVVASGDSNAITATVEAAAGSRELPDVTGFLVVVLVTLGLFVVPVGATIMQGPAIVASIFGR
jgi:hypothetical protein